MLIRLATVIQKCYEKNQITNFCEIISFWLEPKDYGLNLLVCQLILISVVQLENGIFMSVCHNMS